MKTHTLRVKDGKAHHAIDTDCAEFKDRFLIFIYVDERGDPTAVRLLDSWQGEAPRPTPTPSGASADTIATATTHPTPDATHACSTPSDQIREHSTPSAPPPTEEPEAVRTVRATLDIFPYAHGTAGKLLAAYDAERAKLSRIAAILSDDSAEKTQRIGLALRVARGQP